MTAATNGFTVLFCRAKRCLATNGLGRVPQNVPTRLRQDDLDHSSRSGNNDSTHNLYRDSTTFPSNRISASISSTAQHLWSFFFLHSVRSISIGISIFTSHIPWIYHGFLEVKLNSKHKHRIKSLIM